MTAAFPDFPLFTQANAQTAFDFVYAPWIKDVGLTDFEVREGFCAMRLPLQGKLKFFSGAICGQALMSAIDTVQSLLAARDSIARCVDASNAPV